MTNTQRLKQLANIYSGYAFRGAVTSSLAGKISVIQSKDIKSYEYFSDISELTKIDLEIPRSNSFLRDNDVLLVSRGSGNHRATVFKSGGQSVIASSTLYIIRIKDSNVIPEFVSLYLNSVEGQNQLSQITSGAYIQNITRKNLDELEIPVPTISQQKLLVSLQENIRQQEQLLKQNSEIKKNIINQAIRKITR